jgi:hypothetical protein
LAHALAKKMAIGKAIPTNWHQAVVEVLSFVYQSKKRAWPGWPVGRPAGRARGLAPVPPHPGW